MKSSLEINVSTSQAQTIGGYSSDLLAKGILILIRVHVGRATAVDTGKRGLGLGGLGLLAALVGRLLLLHLLVAERRHGAGNLLDLVAGEVLGQLLGKLLQEQRVVRLLGARRDDGAQGGAQLLELRLGRGLEDWERAEVDRLVGVVRVDDDVAGGRGLAPAADADGAEEVLGVAEIGLLLGAAQALALLRLGLILALVLLGLGAGAGPLGLAVGDSLGLALLVRGSLRLGLGLGFGSLLCLFALDFGVLSGVPRV